MYMCWIDILCNNNKLNDIIKNPLELYKIGHLLFIKLNKYGD